MKGPDLRLLAPLALALSALSLLPEARAETTPDWSGLSDAAKNAPDAAAIVEIAGGLRAALSVSSGDTSTDELATATGVYGVLVGRSQEIEAASGVFAELVELAAPLEQRATARREKLEGDAGEDEVLLESLYRSDSWQLLSRSRVEISFWLGWAQLARVQRGLEGTEREAALVDAERAFARAARALVFPGLAIRSLLGLGMARRERGDFEGARQSFERMQAQRAILADPALAALVRYELALTSIDALDMTSGEKLATELEAAGVLTPRQSRALEARRIRAWLTIAGQRPGPQAEQATSEAAGRLRGLLARGGDDEALATRLVAEFADQLVGSDLGDLGALLEADQAFLAEDWERALTRYAVVLDGPPPAGIDLVQARLRASYCKVQLDRSEEAALDLEALLENDLTKPQRVDVARLLQSIAESRLRSAPGTSSREDLARANRAARLLLETAPDAEGADAARVRRARELTQRGRTDAALGLLAEVPRESPAYPAALLERVRLETQRLDAMSRSRKPGTRGSPSLRKTAARLAQSLDEVTALRENGELPPDPGQDSTMAALRARAALHAGEELAHVEARIARIRASETLDRVVRDELLAVEIAALAAAGETDRVLALLAAREDDRLRAEFVVWEESLADLDASLDAAALPGVHARLLSVAPGQFRNTLRLGEIAALRRVGRSAEAVTRARELAEDDPESGDAWLELGRSLDAAGDHSASPEIWRRVGGSADPGSESWWEAHLALHDAALARSETKKACGWIDATGETPAAPALAARIRRAREECSERRGPDGPTQP